MLTLKGENAGLQGVVVAARAAYQATYLQAKAPKSSVKVASQLAGVPGWLAEIVELGLSTGAQMALVVARAF